MEERPLFGNKGLTFHPIDNILLKGEVFWMSANVTSTVTFTVDKFNRKV